MRTMMKRPPAREQNARAIPPDAGLAGGWERPSFTQSEFCVSIRRRCNPRQENAHADTNRPNEAQRIFRNNGAISNISHAPTRVLAR